MPGPESEALHAVRTSLGKGDVAAALELLWAGLDDPGRRALLVELLVADRDREALARVFATPASRASDRALEEAISAHLQGRPRQAAALCQQLLQREADNARAANHLGRALFNLGRAAEAKAAFERALSLQPGYSQALNNLGHVERASGQQAAAMQHFAEAVRLAPGFIEARMNLGIGLLAETRPEQALPHFEAVIAQRPELVDARINAGSCLHMMRRYAEAEAHYRFGTEQAAPPVPLAFRQLAKLYIETARIDEAIDTFRRVCRLVPDAADVRAELISTLEKANRLDEAAAELESALAQFPRDAVLQYEMAKIERRRGQPEAAVARLSTLPADRIPAHLQQWFHFDLGTALDACGRYDEAFAAFQRSNAFAQRGMRARMADWGALDRIFDSLQDWTAQGCPAPACEASEDQGEDLVFLLGFPRSGTTLLDLLLDGHPDVQSLEERQTIEHVFWQVDQRFGRFPHGLAHTGAGDRQALRALYRRRLQEEGVKPGHAGLVVDKMPMRTAYAGFIHRLFPRARILFALRHPLDVVLSNFMQNYAANEVFVHFNALDEVARVYARSMDIWRETQGLLPEAAWTKVRYEDLVADRDTVLRGVCDFLGIDWQAGMGDHLRTLEQRPHIKTNSYHQVTQPIHARSSGRWRHYRRHLEPVLPTLARYLEAFGYDGAGVDAPASAPSGN